MRQMKKLLLGLAGLIMIVLFPNLLFAQTKTISGRITDNRNNPVPGATIVAKKTAQSTVTDADGKFTATVPENSVITVSSIGFRTQTITINASTADLQIKLDEDVARLDEVVITALQPVLKRRNLANAVATISSKELNGIAPAQTFDAALNGKIPERISMPILARPAAVFP